MIPMNDNKSAFQSNDYDNKIVQTLPYYYDFYNQVIDLIKTIKKNNNISWLDIGCGTGNMSKRALDNFNIKNMVLCDTSIKMLELSKLKLLNYLNIIEFKNKSALDLKYLNTFDVVTSIQVNHYFNFDDRIKSVQNSYNALKCDGVFITFENFMPFSSIGRDISLNRWKNYQISNGKSVKDSTNHISRCNQDYFPITITQHLDILKSCGFKVVEILWVSYMQIGFYAIK